MGFQGKMCIHLETSRSRWSTASSPRPTPRSTSPQRVVAAFAQAEKEGSAAIQLDGKFIDYPIVYRAQRTLDAMAAIRARSAK